MVPSQLAPNAQPELVQHLQAAQDPVPAALPLLALHGASSPNQLRHQASQMHFNGVAPERVVTA